MAKKTPTPHWLTDAERRAWRNFSLMQLQLMGVLGRELAGDGLSWADYGVLAHLSDAPDHRARLTELGRDLGWEKSRISHHISRMEQRGLVTRERCPSDQRGWFVVMSPAGHEAIRAAAPGHVAMVRRYFIDLLTPEQIATLDAISQTVLDQLATEP